MTFPASGSWVLVLDSHHPQPSALIFLSSADYSSFTLGEPPILTQYSGFKRYIFVCFNPIFCDYLLPASSVCHSLLPEEWSLSSSDFPAQPFRLEMQCFLTHPSLSLYIQPVCLH